MNSETNTPLVKKCLNAAKNTPPKKKKKCCSQTACDQIHLWCGPFHLLLAQPENSNRQNVIQTELCFMIMLL